MGRTAKSPVNPANKIKNTARKKLQLKNKVCVRKQEKIAQQGNVRTPLKEKAWKKVQAAPTAATVLMKKAPDPQNLAGHKGLRKLLSDAKLISEMSLGKHGAQRTPVPKLKQAIGRIQSNSRYLPGEGREFVESIADGMLDHLGCANTDKSFKPFAVVLVAVLQLARMSESAKQ